MALPNLFSLSQLTDSQNHNVIVDKINDHCLRIAVNSDATYPWHSHPNSEELFAVLEGNLVIELEGQEPVSLLPGDLYKVAQGIKHRTIARGRTINLCFEATNAETFFASQSHSMLEIRVFTELTDQVLEEFLEIFAIVFGECWTREKVKKRVVGNEFFLSIHAYKDGKIVGFKSGYSLNDKLFYSWIGGVDPSFRRMGLAKRLMDLQHARLREQGFLKVQTKTQNQWKEMMIANLKAGFAITNTFWEEERGLQILMEKTLKR